MDKRLSSFLSTVASVCMALVIWTLVLAISFKNQKPFDITKNAKFTLAPQSKQAVTNLPQPVKVFAFVTDKEKPQIKEVLERYAAVDSQKFTFAVLDPKKNPTLAKQYGIRFPGEGVVELQEKDSKGRTERLSAIGEEEITAALLKLQRRKSYKAYFTTGHGERELNGSDGRAMTQLKGDLTKEGFIVESLTMTALKDARLPADADLIVCAGPTKPLLPGEETLLKDYLANYGRFMLLTEPETPAQYTELVKPYGITVSDDVVLDQSAEILMRAEPIFAVGLVFDPSHPITKDTKIQTLFELARPLTTATPPPAGVVLTRLVSTSDNPQTGLLVPLKDVLGALKGGGPMRLDPAKLKPTTALLAAAASKKEEAPKPATPTPSPSPAADKVTNTKEMRLVVMGDADVVSTGSSLALYTINKDLVLNSFNWLAANETQISIRPKDELSAPLHMTGGDQQKMLFFLVIVLPIFLVGMGVFNVMRRQ